MSHTAAAYVVEYSMTTEKGRDDMPNADMVKAHEAVDHAAAKLREAAMLLRRAGARGAYVGAVRDAARAAQDAEAAMLDEVYAD